METGSEKQICTQGLNWDMLTAVSPMGQGVKVGETEVEHQSECTRASGPSHSSHCYKGARSLSVAGSGQPRGLTLQKAHLLAKDHLCGEICSGLLVSSVHSIGSREEDFNGSA